MGESLRAQWSAYLRKVFAERMDRELGVAEARLELALAELQSALPEHLKAAKEYLKDG